MSLTIPKFTLPFSSPAKNLTCIAQLTNVPAKISTTPSVSVGRREGLFFLTAAGAAIAQLLPSPSKSLALVLEADDDLELLEKVKKDRKKRLERQGVISSSVAETGYLQELVYKLSKVGQAIEKSDFSAASSVLGQNTNADWVQNVNKAFTKLSSSSEEKTEVDEFNSSLASLFTSVSKQDVEASKVAFVSSASALEKWIDLTGLNARIKGL
ncbi:Thylakoid lumenal 16.5 kDa protein [Rhynchospora pubera]|uniref:Thylakoid lumenal 16.5 kDa protein n=1 Tax=Rhynchospora pubera TaxID=906938 RepID=A0AAV8HLH6_9POAL|nr:Thylakoid lumenal 16.5 kDa protein [Rhynchospora pubera]